MAGGENLGTGVATAPAAESATGLATVAPSTLQVLKGAGLDLGLGKPFADPIRLIDKARVAGTSYVADIEELASGLLAGDRLTLQREPLNMHDKRAIKVLSPDGNKLGYLPADVNDIPSRLMDAGKELYAQVLDTGRRGKYTFIEIEVFLND